MMVGRIPLNLAHSGVVPGLEIRVASGTIVIRSHQESWSGRGVSVHFVVSTKEIVTVPRNDINGFRNHRNGMAGSSGRERPAASAGGTAGQGGDCWSRVDRRVDRTGAAVAVVVGGSGGR